MPEKPLSRASSRLLRAWEFLNRPLKMPVPVREHRVAELAATTDLPKEEIALQVGVTRRTVHRDLAKPHVKQSIKEMREAIKQAILEESARDIIEPAMQMAREKIATGDAKGFDATMRGLNALEKTTQSASGEALKVDATVAAVVLNRQEIFSRIEHILAST